MEQTGLEWLEQTIGVKHMNTFLKNAIEKAKEIDKENLEKLKDFETWKEWKNETFKSE
jgi:hypothetical protein